MKGKLLITGASGFIGSTLVAAALDREYEVYAGVRRSSSLKYLTDSSIRRAYLDFEKEDELAAHLQEASYDYIIHNAGITKAKDKETYFKVNTSYVKVLLDAITASGRIPKKLIFVSSLASYGPADYQINDIVDNDSLPMPITTYGESKLAAEKILYNHKGGIPFLIFRPTVVYGPKESDFFSLISLINKRMELYIGAGDAQLSFIYVKDLVRLFLDALKSDHTRKAYFLGDGKIYNQKIVSQSIKKILGKKTLPIYIPLPGIWVLCYILEKVSLIMGKLPVLNPEKYNEIKCQSWAIDCAPIKEDFNFVAQYKLSEGLEETIAWYKKHNWL